MLDWMTQRQFGIAKIVGLCAGAITVYWTWFVAGLAWYWVAVLGLLAVNVVGPVLWGLFLGILERRYMKQQLRAAISTQEKHPAARKKTMWEWLLAGVSVPARVAGLIGGVATTFYLHNGQDLPQLYAVPIGVGVYLIILLVWAFLSRLFQPRT